MLRNRRIWWPENTEHWKESLSVEITCPEGENRVYPRGGYSCGGNTTPSVLHVSFGLLLTFLRFSNLYLAENSPQGFAGWRSQQLRSELYEPRNLIRRKVLTTVCDLLFSGCSSIRLSWTNALTVSNHSSAAIFAARGTDDRIAAFFQNWNNYSDVDIFGNM